MPRTLLMFYDCATTAAYIYSVFLYISSYAYAYILAAAGRLREKGARGARVVEVEAGICELQILDDAHDDGTTTRFVT